MLPNQVKPMGSEIPLFWQDAYMKEFDATVLSASGEGEKSGKIITLDKTIFYPQGGGQPSDFGVLKRDGEEFKILFSGKSDDGKVFHEVDKAGLKEYDKVHGILDWERRYKLMRMHTTAHLVAAVIHKETGALITGNQLGIEESRIDFSLENYNKEKVQGYIDKANRLIAQNIPVTAYFISMEEARKDESLFKLAKGFGQDLKELRIVEIKGVDKQAYGGTHVKSLGEIGKVIFVKAENKGKDNRRIYFRLE